MESYDYEELVNGVPTEVDGGEKTEVLASAVSFTYTTSNGLRENLED